MEEDTIWGNRFEKKIRTNAHVDSIVRIPCWVFGI